VQLAAEQRFDLVLMDVQMPGMDGHAATRAIRAQEAAHALPRVPVIALSASVLSDDRRAALEAGMDAFVSKPVDLPELSVQMARVLGLAENAERVPYRPGARPQLLNIEQALARWGGQREPYLRALRHFVNEYTKLPTLLSNYGEFGGASEARSLAHRVKGMAGNLGLEKLAELLDEIERSLITDTAIALRPLLARLRHLIYDSFAAVDLELAKAATIGSGRRSTQPIDVARIRSLGDHLSARFQRGEFDSAAFAQLLDALTGNVEEAQLDELQRIVDEFDFVAADAMTRQICNEFELPLAAIQA
jgi:CheY-like chemotaxis protein